MPPFKTSHKLLVAFGGFLALLFGWRWLGYPTSLDEASFLRKLSSQVTSGTQELRLSDLMPGDWELVCESHGYDGPLYLKRYNKIFEPVAPPQDGVWGLIFISNDGSYKSAVGSCRVPGVRLYTNGCTERGQAVLLRGTSHGECPEFKVRHRLTNQSTGLSKAALLPSRDFQRYETEWET